MNGFGWFDSLSVGDQLYVLFGGQWHAARVTAVRANDPSVRPGHVRVSVQGGYGDYQVDSARVHEARPVGRL